MMDFFEVLRERAFEDAEDFVLHELDCKHTPTGAEFASMGIDSAIAAPKEMTVGEPIRMWLIHDGTITRLIDENRRHIRLWQTHKGTDGEEVVVMVFKKP